MMKTINAASGGMVHVYTKEPDYGNPDTVNIMTEMANPVEFTDAEAQEFATALSAVINESQIP